eukprot:s279_g8.t1
MAVVACKGQSAWERPAEAFVGGQSAGLKPLKTDGCGGLQGAELPWKGLRKRLPQPVVWQQMKSTPKAAVPVACEDFVSLDQSEVGLEIFQWETETKQKEQLLYVGSEFLTKMFDIKVKEDGTADQLCHRLKDCGSVYQLKVQLVLAVWPSSKLPELITRLILNTSGSAFAKLQLHHEELCINNQKGVKRLIELLGESHDSYLARADILWTKLMTQKLHITLRGSLLTSDDKKRVILESDSSLEGKQTINRVQEAIRLLGTSFSAAARKKLSEKVKSRGFWPLQKGKGKVFKGKGKFKSIWSSRKSLQQRILETNCRLCGKKGHWKSECSLRNQAQTGSSAAAPVNLPWTPMPRALKK